MISHFFSSFILLLVFMFSWARPAISQTWVESTGVAAVDNITPQEARIKALRGARQIAIEQVCGVKVQAEAMVKEFILAGDFVHAISYGEIIEEEILREEVVVEQSNHRTPPNLTYKVSLKANVKKGKGEPDPNFRVEMKLNRSTFQDGDELVITVKSTVDCYLNVINVTADDRALLLFPNRYDRDNLLPAGRTLQIPTAQAKSGGIVYRVGRIPGHSSDSEIIKVIATKRPLDLHAHLSLFGDIGDLGSPETAVTDLMMVLSRIPVYERAEDGEIYEIVGP